MVRELTLFANTDFLIYNKYPLNYTSTTYIYVALHISMWQCLYNMHMSVHRHTTVLMHKSKIFTQEYMYASALMCAQPLVFVSSGIQVQYYKCEYAASSMNFLEVMLSSWSVFNPSQHSVTQCNMSWHIHMCDSWQLTRFNSCLTSIKSTSLHIYLTLAGCCHTIISHYHITALYLSH